MSDQVDGAAVVQYLRKDPSEIVQRALNEAILRVMLDQAHLALARATTTPIRPDVEDTPPGE